MRPRILPSSHCAAWCVVVVAGLGLAGVQVHAQTRIHLILSGVYGPGCEPYPEPHSLQCYRQPGAILEIDVESATVVSQTVIPEQPANPGLTVTADGRYVVWGGNDGRSATESATFLSYRDRVTNIATPAYRQPFPIPLDSTMSTLVAHPTDVRVYASLPAALLEASADGIRPMSTFAEFPLAIAPQGDVAVRDRHVVDLGTGRVICTLPQAPWFRFAFSRDGSVLYGTTVGTAHLTTVIARVDARTCLRELEREVSGGGLLSVDPVTERVFLGLTAFDGRTLEPIGTVTVAPGAFRGYRMVFEDHRPRAYRLSMPSISDSPPFLNRVEVIDTESLAVIAAGDLVLARRATDIAVVPVPPPPQGVQATVQGTAVRIAWQAGRGPGLATGYRLEAGSASRLADLATFERDGTEFAVAGVPAGTYFVRVRALNAAGVAGPPSSEIVVTVGAGPP